MNTEDNDNLYVLNDEELSDIDDSPRNFAQYKDNEREPEEENDVIKERPVYSLGLLFKIMFNPIEGWKKLRRSKISVESLQSGCFYPLLAMLAISKFAEFFYSVNVNLSQVISAAVIAFVSFFFGYFCIQMILSWVLPSEMSQKIEDKFGKEYTIMGLSTLALFTIFTNLLPMLWPVLIFLPIWTLYLLFKGIRFFKLKEKQEMKFYVITAAAIIAVPYFLDWGLNVLLPY